MPAKWHKYSYTAQRDERRTFIAIIVFLVFSLVLFTLIHNYAVTMYKLQAKTMEPTLYSEERIISSPLYSARPGEKTGFSLFFSSERGDIVVISPINTDSQGTLKTAFRSIVSFITFQKFRPFSSEDTPGKKPLIRRLLGYPGDSLYMDNFILHIKPADSSHYLTEFELVSNPYELRIDPLPEGWNTNMPFSNSFEEITLGTNEYFVLCDNRSMASDCRIWGPITRERIVGKVLFRYWPFKRFEKF